MFYKLIFAVVLYRTEATFIRSKKLRSTFGNNLLVVSMPSFVILTVSYGSKLFVTILAKVRLFTGVCSHMDQQITLFGKDLSAIANFALEQVLTRMR